LKGDVNGPEDGGVKQNFTTHKARLETKMKRPIKRKRRGVVGVVKTI